MTDNSELVERLRRQGNENWAVLMDRSADAIEALQAALTQRHTDDINDFAALCVDRDSYRDRCKGLEQERDHWKARAERAEAALEKLRPVLSLLYANAEGCAVNHYGADFEQQGLPGWLADTKQAIVEALDHQEGEQ